MAHRRKTSPAEDLVDLVALMPWYVGIALAGIGYVILHSWALSPVAVTLKPGDVSHAMVGAMTRGLATAGQYILPLICLAGAAVSAWRRRERRTLVVNVTKSCAADMLDNMNWREFEMLIGEGFRLQGYSVLENFEGGPDGGIDLTLRKDGEKFLVQCKQWRAFKVGVTVVRELYGVMAAQGATGGYVVTSGQFSAEAEAFAKGRNLHLIDGPKLQQLLRQARSAAAIHPTAKPPVAPIVKGTSQSAQAHAVSCPKCSLPMVRRTAKKGANAGQEFWGCLDYPRCRGTA